MKVAIVGSGGREHAIAWKLSQSSHRPGLLIAPGNAGTAALGENVQVSATDLEGQVKLARDRKVDLVLVGPDDPIAMGLGDRLRASGIKTFSPSAAAARIESSKSWAKQLMARHGIPTGRSETFTDLDRALAYARLVPPSSIVIKADGLAAGKGVILPSSREQAESALQSMLAGGAFGAAGRTALIEERLFGPEVSVFAFVCGDFVSPEIAACDYKRALDGDAGPNTGGMGSYTPPEFWTPDLARRVRSEVLEPTAKAMVREGCPFNGTLYASLMLTQEGPRVIEFNARLGDPEAQVVLPALKSDLLELCLAIAEGRPGDVKVEWDARPRVCVVMASGGYPGEYKTGRKIQGIEKVGGGVTVFHAGTRQGPGGATVTNGGRVLGVVADGATMREAHDAAYLAVEKIEFANAHYRKDIAVRAVAAQTGESQRP